MNNIARFLPLVRIEMLFWIGALIFLLTIDPYGQEHHSLCLFKNLGLSFCPGCGLGRSIALIFRGDIAASFQMHPLGIPALVMILIRIKKLFKNLVYNYKIIGGLYG